MVNGCDPVPLGTLKGMLAHGAVHTCQQWAGPEAPIIGPEGRGRLIIIGADEEVQMEDILQGRPGGRKEQDYLHRRLIKQTLSHSRIFWILFHFQRGESQGRLVLLRLSCAEH